MLSWISEQFSHYKPERAIAVRALRHMRAAERKNLFSEDIMLMRTAEGYWFEYLIYEQLIRIAEQTTTIKRVVRKGADVPKHREKIQLGQNGIYSAEKGDIRVRGNGQDLAEVDLLLFDKDKQVVFCEIITSPADLKDLEAEIVYKKKLFGYMFNQEHVGFILFSSVDISCTQVVRGLVSDPDNAYVGTNSCEIMKSCLKGLRITSFPTRPEKNPKLIPSETLKIRDFNYKKLHDDALTKLYFAMDHDMSPDQYFSDPSVSPLVKKVICGGLYPSAVKALVTDYGLRVKTDILDIGKLEEEYTKVILAVDFPKMSPVIYIKPKKQRTYLKMVPLRTGGFKYERLTPSRVGFYLWLEAAKPSLGAERVMTTLEYCGTPKKNCAVEPVHEHYKPAGAPRLHHHPRKYHK